VSPFVIGTRTKATAGALVTRLAVALACFVAAPGEAAAQHRLVTMGTGGVTGVYYPVGGTICRLVNRERKENGLRCTVESTPGSAYNLVALRGGEFDLALTQSDLQHRASRGEGEFASAGADAELRAVFAIHAEPFTVLVRRNSGIRKFGDLRRKRLSVGNPGSGQRETMAIVMAAFAWRFQDFAAALELRASEQPQALCDDKIDAMVLTIGHPSAAIRQATTNCEAVLVPVAGPTINRLMKSNPYFDAVVIPGGLYRGNQRDIQTFGVRAMLVASARLPEGVVYQIVKAVFENFEAFREAHPALNALDRKAMAITGASAPSHPGAARYFKEIGLP
jgi:TRAP transporter TAXI family solute receptor